MKQRGCTRIHSGVEWLGLLNLEMEAIHYKYCLDFELVRSYVREGKFEKYLIPKKL